MRSGSILRAVLVLAGLIVANLGGCQISIQQSSLNNAETQLQNDTTGNFQSVDPRSGPVPSGAGALGDTVVLDPSVTVVTDVATDITPQAAPDLTVVGFDNRTTFDAYIRYAVNGVVQGVFVYDETTLLLDYPCIDTVELLSEDHFDPSSGVFVEGFDLTGTLFQRPVDFDCGDTFILTFDPEAITATTEVIAL